MMITIMDYYGSIGRLTTEEIAVQTQLQRVI
jgi:hypothetical protein